MPANPISVVIGANTHSLPRLSEANGVSLYRKKGSNFEVEVQIRHSYEGKVGAGQFERHNVDLKYTSFDVDLKPTVTQAYTVLRVVRGTDGVLLGDVSEGLNAFVDANQAALIAWEP